MGHNIASISRKVGMLSPVQRAIRGHGTIGKQIDKSMTLGERAGPLILGTAASIYTLNPAPLMAAAGVYQADAQKSAADAQKQQLKDLAKGPPTLDVSGNQISDRLRRRKGVLANIYSDGSASGTVGRPQLLGG